MLRDQARPEIKYIGRSISIKTIIDAIHKFELTDTDTILLNAYNFDDIVIEYREIYGESINIPYLELTVLIEEDKSKRVPKDRIGILKNDFDSNRSTDSATESF